MSESENMELVKVGDLYPVLNPNSGVQELIKENLGGQQFQRGDLQKITIPLGGSTTWQLPGIGDDKIEAVSFQGIIIRHRLERRYYKEGYTGESGPPDCQSDDCLTGVGDPGGDCLNCALAKYGSAEVGEGQACKQTHAIYLIQEGQNLPSELQIPPTSLRKMKKFLTDLVNFGIPFFGCVIAFSLEKHGTVSVVAPKLVRPLEEDEQNAVIRFKEFFEGSLKMNPNSEEATPF